MKHSVITIFDIDNRIRALATDISHEKNTKEKARLVDEQAALKLVKRTMKQHMAQLV